MPYHSYLPAFLQFDSMVKFIPDFPEKPSVLAQMFENNFKGPLSLSHFVIRRTEDMGLFGGSRHIQ